MGYIVDAAKRLGHNVITAGSAHGRNMPYATVSVIPEKYVREPDIAFPAMDIGDSYVPVEMVEDRLTVKPDLWIQVNAGFYLDGKPKDGVNVLYETDPHTGLRGIYDKTRSYYDLAFCPQTEYAKDGEIYLPYAADSVWHTPMDKIDKIYDVCIVGNYYQTRVDLIEHLRSSGKNCFFQLGLTQDDSRLVVNQSRICINWSSMNDLTARVFETMGSNIPLLANRIKDLDSLFIENEHFYGFSSMEEAITKVDFILNNYGRAIEVSNNAYEQVNLLHRWEHRINKILELANIK